MARDIPRTLGGVVAVDALRVRDLPERDSPVLTILTRGSRISIHNHLSGWYEILLEDGRRGFVSDKREHVELRETPLSEAEAKKLQEEMTTHEKRFSGILQQELSVIEQLHRIDAAIDHASKELDRLKRQKNETDELACALGVRQKKALEAYRSAQRAARERIRARYRLMQTGAASLIAPASSLADWIFRKDMLGWVLQADESIRKRLLMTKDGYEHLSAEIAEKRRSLQEIERMTQLQLSTLSEEKKRRRLLLAGVRSKKALEMRAIAGIQEAMNRLERWFDQWQEEERAETTLNGPNSAPPGVRSFDRMKSRLYPPVPGKMLHADQRPGLLFRAQAGDPVHAVSSGKVVYSDWFKGYGNMIVIDHEKHYFSIYAHLTDRFKSTGQSVQAGEVIGTAGTTDIYGTSGIYFEMRNRSRPIESKPWFREKPSGPISLPSQGKEAS